MTTKMKGIQRPVGYCGLLKKLEKKFVAVVQKDLDHLDKLKDAYCLLKTRFDVCLGGNDEWYGDSEEEFWKDMKKLGASWQKGLKESGPDEDLSWDDPEEAEELECWIENPAQYSVILVDPQQYASEAIVYVRKAFKNTFLFLDKHKIRHEFGDIQFNF